MKHYFSSELDRTFNLLKKLRSGQYYPASNARTFLINSYKDLVASLTIEDYQQLKVKLVSDMCGLIADRDARLIAYSLLSDMVRYSCVNDFDVYLAYEKEILKLAKTNKDKYFYHVVTLAQTKVKLLGNISDIEDFFIITYLQPSRIKSINFQYLTDFTLNIPSANKRKLLSHLFKCRPFRDDKQFINRYITHHDELKKYAVLI